MLSGKQEGDLALADFDQIRKEIDDRLAQGQWALPVNLSLGSEIYQAFKERGLLPVESFGNPAHPNEPIQHEAYAGNVWVIEAHDLSPSEYVIGKGGDF